MWQQSYPIREAVEAYNEQNPDDPISDPLSTLGWIIGDYITDSEWDAERFFAYYQSEHAVDVSYQSAIDEYGNVTIDAFASTRDNWTINGIDYDDSDEAAVAMETYHNSIKAIAVDGWTGEETCDDFKEAVYTVGDNTNLSESAATAALTACKEAHPVTEGYDSVTVAEKVTGHETVYKIEGSDTEYETEEAAEAARAEEAGKEPAFSDVAGVEDYNKAHDTWEGAEPDQSDYKYSDLDKDAYNKAAGEYADEPAKDDYLDRTSYDTDLKDWKTHKPEKEDYKAEDTDAGNEEG